MVSSVLLPGSSSSHARLSSLLSTAPCRASVTGPAWRCCRGDWASATTGGSSPPPPPLTAHRTVCCGRNPSVRPSVTSVRPSIRPSARLCVCPPDQQGSTMRFSLVVSSLSVANSVSSPRHFFSVCVAVCGLRTSPCHTCKHMCAPVLLANAT